jgi:hypothetical protein
MKNENTPWVLEEFIDSLVIELDKTRETLAVKAINKPLSYSVKELSIDLNAFPTYDGDEVKFTTALPGQSGASKLTIQLGSITDQQVRATSKPPSSHGDIKIDEIPVPATTKKSLRKLGVNSVDDLKKIESKNVDLKKATDDEIDYSGLLNQIQKAQRDNNPPAINRVSMSMEDGGQPCLTVEGKNLAVNPKFPPVAVMNGVLADVVASDSETIKINLNPGHRLSETNELILTVDPFAVVKVNVRAKS